MEKEYRHILGRFSEDRVCSMLSGIGKANAAMCAASLIERRHPEAVISAGAAGSFAEGVRVGDVILSTRVAYHDVWCGEESGPGVVQGMPKFFEADPLLLDRARKAFVGAKPGLVITGDQFYIGEEEDLRQKSLYPDALAVDMEAAAVAQVCFTYGVPFLAVKVVSDTHGGGLQGEQYEAFWREKSEDAFDLLAGLAESLLLLDD